MKNYNEVPNIISGKDLDYLSDIFNWNYGAYKNLKNEELVTIFEEASSTFYNNMNTVLNILNQGGQNE